MSDTTISPEQITYLDVPAKLNPETISKFSDDLNAVKKSVRIVVFQNKEDAIFCSGMDLSGLVEQSADCVREAAKAFYELLDRIRAESWISVCLVNGNVAGGGVGIVASADFVLATERATFHLPEALWGLTPALIIKTLLGRVSPATVKKMVLTSQHYTAQQALSMGLVDQIVSHHQFDTELAAIASKVRRCSSTTVSLLKRQLIEISAHGGYQTFDQTYSLLEQGLNSATFRKRRETIRAYLEFDQ